LTIVSMLFFLLRSC